MVSYDSKARWRGAGLAAAALSLLFLPGISACRPEPVPSRPNILLITLDTVRADRLGCYCWGSRLG